MFIQVFSTLSRINTKLLLGFLIICIVVFLYSYFTNTKHQKKLYSKELSILPDLIKWIIILISYSFFMYSLVDLDVDLGNDQTEKVFMMGFWVTIISVIFVFFTSLIIEFDTKRFKNKVISFVTSKWSKIAFSLVAIVIVTIAYGFLTNAIMYIFALSENLKVSSTKLFLYEFYELKIEVVFISILIGFGLPALLITNKFWSYIVETLIAEKEVVDILLASGNIIRNVYLYKSPIGKYIYVGNNKQHASATQIVAVNKKDIETILFKKEYEKYHEKNQIIIQKRKR